ncbi:MAG: ABC transporter permease [Actinomycetota bacterium]|nr:ABC transporter permease [Actinomycetota bacterium]
MAQLLRAEWRKVRTTRVVYGLLAGSVAFAVLGVVGGILGAGENDSFALETPEGVRNVFGAAAGGTALLAILGILGVTNEFRHGTIVPTLLVTPDRARVVGAKLATFALAGIVFAVVGCAVTIAIAVPWLAARDIDFSVTSRDVAVPLAGAVLAFALYGMLGVGVGTLIHNQVAAIVITLVWMMIIEGLIVALLPSVGRWLPGGALASVIGTANTRGDYLPMWAGAVLLVAYVVAFAVAGTVLTTRRDIR